MTPSRSARSAVLAPLVAVALLLAACGGDDAPDAASAGTTTTAAGAAGPVRITDDTGTVVKLDAPAERVVAVEWDAVENTIALGVQPVGAGDLPEYRDWVGAGDAPAASVKGIGTRYEPNLERIAALEPDLIIGVPYNFEKTRKKLEQIAPVAVFDPYPVPKAGGPTEWSAMRNEVTQIGTLLGRAPQAKALLARLDATIAKQKQAIADAGAAGQKITILQGFTDGKPAARAFDDGSQMFAVANALGLRNELKTKPVQYGYKDLTLEGLRTVGGASWMLTIALSKDDPFTGAWGSNPAFKSLPVVADGHLRALGGDTWVWGGPLSAELVANRIATAVTSGT